MNTLGVKPVIQALRQKSTSIHESTMQSLFNKLPELNERQQTIIRRLTKSIVNQMLHDPIHRIKEMAGEEDGDEALKMFAHIFALEEQREEESRELSKEPSDDVAQVLTLV
ncbi:Glutamyl-tRNA reductase [compost metagenome]